MVSPQHLPGLSHVVWWRCMAFQRRLLALLSRVGVVGTGIACILAIMVRRWYSAGTTPSHPTYPARRASTHNMVGSGVNSLCHPYYPTPCLLFSVTGFGFAMTGGFMCVPAWLVIMCGVATVVDVCVLLWKEKRRQGTFSRLVHNCIFPTLRLLVCVVCLSQRTFSLPRLPPSTTCLFLFFSSLAPSCMWAWREKGGIPRCYSHMKRHFGLACISVTFLCPHHFP